MAADFLAENNLCGQALLRLVARGNATIAELFRLSDYIPKSFRQTTNNKYNEIIFDFNYLSNQVYYDTLIQSKPELQTLDDEFKVNHLEILTRFYLAFESIHKYVTDLNRFLEDLEEGIYIQQNVDTVLFNQDGKQLLSESVYIYGLMLLISDMKFEGSVREKLLIAYVRYSNQKSYMDSNIDDVCKLLRSTGFSSSKPKPQNYPESFFGRIKINPNILSQIIGRLRTDDLYNQMNAFPLPEHRSHALSNQASMLYILLFFRADILNNEQAVMREIVDKFFPDNWILSIYMGSIQVNLAESWDSYKAARSALANTLNTANIKQQSIYHMNKINECIKEVNETLNEGFLTQDYLLTSLNKILNLLRKSNVTLKWSMLHTSPLSPFAEANKKLKLIRDQVLRDFQFEPMKILNLLLNLSQLEFNVRNCYKSMIEQKQTQWELLKKEAKERTEELSEVFSGQKPLTRIAKNENLQKWFLMISGKIDALNYEASGATSTGRDITQIVNAIQEVLNFHEIDKNLQVKQFIQDTANFLLQMINTSNIKEDALIQIQIISDLSYALELIDNFTNEMQSLIKNKPNLVIKLRATFLKLGYALDLPLLRITQANSSDFGSVTQYYSLELVSYVRKVLQIIPISMFNLLAKIISIQTNKLKEVPTLLDKDKLKDYSQLDYRYEISKLTYSISLYTQGILQMKSANLGCVTIDSKQLLEDGIRKELVKQITMALHAQIQFSGKNSLELMNKLEKLTEQIDGFRRSFEYIQDYVNIYGLRIWQEEFSRIIYFHVEQECNNFTKKKIFEFESIYQSKNIPIPVYPPLAPNDPSVNFIGRLAREILRMTDPKMTYYLPKKNAWYDLKTKEEVINLRLFKKLEQSLNSFGLHGIDRLFSFMITKDLQIIYYNLKQNSKAIEESFKTCMSQMQPLDSISSLNIKFYSSIFNKFQKLFTFLLDIFLRVGQMQLLRTKICYQLNNEAKFDSKQLLHALKAFNQALLSEVNAHFEDPTNAYPEEENPLIYELNPYLECVGLCEPLKKIYIKTNEWEQISFVMSMFTLSQLSKLPVIKLTVPIFKGSSTAMSTSATNVPMINVALTNSVCMITGVITLLKQFNPDYRNQFVSILSQYVRSGIALSSSQRLTDLPVDNAKVLNFLEDFMDFSGLERKILEVYLPRYVIDQVHSIIS
ncbi:WASH complex subunit strumpellin [Brachionus plicatilis]|uniref:WASH complex subunit strumpellin n=1 Tax=Brachionus plicatilis TaxID=10195 RepID=A0A3M7S337_BRAPC|nr:WASH complex subunit strumpellin [Brachionus plicatilis]